MKEKISPGREELRYKFRGMSLSLRSKFLMSTAVIMVIICLISAFVIYQREKKLLVDSAFTKTEMVMAAVEASRMYIREELRPQMNRRFGDDFFMLEAMSTSYVGRSVMEKLKTNLPDYSYRRVSINARNPLSEADAKEQVMIDYFRANKDEVNWQGLIDDNGEAHYMRFRPVYFEESCMSCHGIPEDAPAQLLSQYGDERGFGHYPGELAGVIAVGIPVQSALSAIEEKTSSVFLAVLFGATLFYIMLAILFNWIVGSNLRGVLNLFRDELDEKNLPEVLNKSVSGDELETLSYAAHNMATHLRQTRDELRNHAFNLERKVADRTKALKDSELLLKERVLTRNQELKALNSIAELTTQAGGMHDIWPEALRQTLSLIPAMGVGIYLLDESGQKMILEYQHNAPVLPLEVSCSDVSHEASLSGPPDLKKSIEYSMCQALHGHMDGFTSKDAGNCLNVPLYCRGNVLGIMSFVVVDFSEISEEQKDLLMSIGRQIGIAIESLSGLQKLLQNKELLQSVFDGITDLVILLDRDYRIKMVNKAYMHKYEVELKDVLDVPCYEAHSGFRSSCPHCDIKKVIQDGKPYISETKCGSGQIYLVHFYPILNERGEVTSIIRYARDITDQKKVEHRIQQTEKLVSMGQLAAGVAHEINNPLGVMLCYIDLLKRQLADFPQGLKDLHIIEKQTLNCKRIVTDLLHFSRGQESTKAPGSLNRTIEEVVQIFKHQFKMQKITVGLDLDPEMPDLNFDENRMKQVFVNLTMNACQAMGKNGEIRIGSRFVQQKNMARVTFRDNGEGMKPEIRNRIFDPFFSTKKTGESTGLGLSVSYGIIQDHGGDISVQSEPGKWTEFTIQMSVSGLIKTAVS